MSNQYRSNKPRYNQQPRQSSTPNTFRFGDIVYFHASLFPTNQKDSISGVPQELKECTGVVVRVPRRGESKVYKVLITGVSTKGPVSKGLVKTLLGSKYLRKEDQLSSNEPVWWKDPERKWVSLNNTKQLEVVNRFKSMYRYK